MEKDENIPAHGKRRLQVYVDDEDVLARALGVSEGDYECATVNASWPDKSLLEGDIILFAEGDTAGAGDIVLIEEDGRIRLGIMAAPGVLDTPRGHRPLEEAERVIGVGRALARKLGSGI